MESTSTRRSYSAARDKVFDIMNYLNRRIAFVKKYPDLAYNQNEMLQLLKDMQFKISELITENYAI